MEYQNDLERQLVEKTEEMRGYANRLEELIGRRHWYERGASLTAFLFLIESLVLVVLWSVGLANQALKFAIPSLVLAFLMAAIDGAMEKDK